jgi:hypothetical protein
MRRPCPWWVEGEWKGLVSREIGETKELEIILVSLDQLN